MEIALLYCLQWNFLLNLNSAANLLEYFAFVFKRHTVTVLTVRKILHTLDRFKNLLEKLLFWLTE